MSTKGWLNLCVDGAAGDAIKLGGCMSFLRGATEEIMLLQELEVVSDKLPKILLA
jgi:hypothetical protein